MVGLGNPRMEGTRHSIGMAVLSAFAARLGVADRWRGDKHVSGEVIVSEVHTGVVLLRPRLLMNINGVSVAKAGEVTIHILAQYCGFLYFLNFCYTAVDESDFVFLAAKYQIKPEDIVLVHDELDKPLGKISIKRGGSARLFFQVLIIPTLFHTCDHGFVALVNPLIYTFR